MFINMEHRRHIGYEVRTLNNLLVRQMESRLKKCDLTVMQTWIIGYIYKNDDKDIFQRDLEAEFSITRSTATSILQLMVRRGFITRQAVPYDDRLKKLCLTEKSRLMHEEALAYFPRMEKMLCAGIAEEDLKTFYRVVAKLKSNLEETVGASDREEPLPL